MTNSFNKSYTFDSLYPELKYMSTIKLIQLSNDFFFIIKEVSIHILKERFNSNKIKDEYKLIVLLIISE